METLAQKSLIFILLFNIHLIKAQNKNDSLNTQIFDSVQVMPSLFYSADSMQNYIQQKIRDIDTSFGMDLKGEAVLTFIVEINGKLTNINVSQNPKNSLSNIAVEIGKSMPLWKPGKQDGKKVRVRIRLPIRYEMYLEEDDSDYFLDDRRFYNEVPAKFPGGNEAMMKFIKENAKYPQEALSNKVQGIVYVRFNIETDGSISNVAIIRGIGSGCDEEAIRLVQMMPKWKPALQNNKPVRTVMITPIKVTLNE